MKIFISTGEVSGDLQGAMLIQSLYRVAAQNQISLEIAGLGGDRMEAAGAKIIANTAGIGSMGLVEGLPFVLPTIKIQKLAKTYLQEFLPDILVIIDYPAPNLALAGYVKRHFPQTSVVYYIAPQDWAVPMLNNVPKITRVVDKLLAIFPDEAEYFQSKNLDVTWVGHPLLDRMEKAPSRQQARSALGIEPKTPIVSLFPASRQQEIKYLLPVICQAAQLIARELPQVQFLIPVSLSQYRQAIESAIAQYNLTATIVEEQTLEAMAAADLAITKSGTVNLELALLDIPQVVVYRVHPVTAWLARRVLRLKIPLMSPPNLILQDKIVPELQQEDVTPDNIAQEAMKLLSNAPARNQTIAQYQKMRSLLGSQGVCDRAAQEILNLASFIN